MQNRLKALYVVRIMQIFVSILLVLNLLFFDKYQYQNSFILYIPENLHFLPFLEIGIYFSLLIIEAIIGSFPLGKFLAFFFIDIVSYFIYMSNRALNLYSVFKTISLLSGILVTLSIGSLTVKPVGKKFNNGASLPRMAYSRTQLRKRRNVLDLWVFITIIVPFFFALLDDYFPLSLLFLFFVLFATGYCLIIIKFDEVVQSTLKFRKTGSFENYCKRLNEILHNDLEKDTQLYVKTMLLQIYSYFDNVDAKNKFTELDEPKFKSLNNAYYASSVLININCGLYDEAEQSLNKVSSLEQY